MSPSPLKIAIVGAGPVGLTLAAILHHNGIPSTIFERESSATARSQGGTLDLHASTGQRALAAAGLLPAFRKISRPEGEASRILKKDGTVVLDENEEPGTMLQEQANGEWKRVGGEKGDAGEEGKAEQEAGDEEEGRGRPEIDRRDLKDLLIAALPEGTIRWGKGIASAVPVPGTQQWKLNFLAGGGTNDPEAGPYDLVLGADGAWSRVRPLLTDVRPLYSGVTALDVWISPEDLAARPDISKLVGQGTCMALADRRFLSLQRHGDGSARCYAMVRTHVEAGAEAPDARTLLKLDDGDGKVEVDWADEKTRKRYLDVHFADYAPQLRDAALAMTRQPTLRPLYMLPVGHRWEPRAGVSLLGDAAHVMTPFAGVGVNVGMMDALELAQGIVGYVKERREREGKKAGDADALARMLRTYEEGMFTRSKTDAEFTVRMMEMEFRDDGPEAVARIMTGAETLD